ncbi:hypothetical protein OC845_000705 [Tilletia horrida]|nr:hypothetical protein OC845_000705 [Tilletia horrida]
MEEGSGEPLQALYLYTHDVARQLKPSSDGELAHALHETLHFALDAQEQDWASPSSSSSTAAAHQHQQRQAECGGVVNKALADVRLVSPTLADSVPSSSTASPLRSPVALPSDASAAAAALPQELPPAKSGFFPNPFWSASRAGTPPSRSGNTSPTRASPTSANFPTTLVKPPSARRRPPYISYGWQARTKTLSLPHPTTISNPTKLDPCSPENRSAFDVTAKLFFLDDLLPSSSHAADGRELEEQIQAQADKLAGYVENALKRLSGSTGIITLDTLLLAFPQATFDASLAGSQGGRSEHELRQALQTRLQVVAELWRLLSPNPQLQSLGLARFSLDSLQTLFHLLASQRGQHPDEGMPHPPGGPPPTTPSITSTLVRTLSAAGKSSTPSNNVAYENARWPDAYSTPRAVRRPRMATVMLHQNGSSAGSQSRSSSSARQSGNASAAGGSGEENKAVAMAIPSQRSPNGDSQAHRRQCDADQDQDQSAALREWCEQEGIVPVADTDRKDVLPKRTIPTLLKEFRYALPHPVPEGHRLVPRWVMKYSVLIRDRGVLADRGYILFAEVEPEPSASTTT